MSTTQSGDREVVTVVSIENTDGSATGHVVLGVLGSLAFVFFLVIILVPIIRWRKRRGSARGTSTTESRASSRRTHTRIVSEYHQDAAAPLLEEQPITTTGGGMAAVNMNVPMVTQPQQGVLSDQGRRTTPSRPPTALLNMKILQTLPNFDEEDESNSSLGRPLEPDERTFPEATTDTSGTGVWLVTDANRRSAALPPIPAPEQPSRDSTLVATSPPTSPLTNAFQRPPSIAPSESMSIANSLGTFRYPSLVSSSSKSSVPTSTALSTPRNTAYTPSPSWMPKSLVPGTGSPVQSETWWRTPSMPPIPESVRSASLSSVQQHGGLETTTKTKRDSSSPSPAAVLRDTSAEAGPSTVVRHVRHLSGEATTATLGSLSRSSTQHTNTDRSNKERDERRVSTLTHGTFGRQGHADSREASHTRGTTESEEGDGGGIVVPPDSPTERTIKNMKRRTLDYPREPSPPLTVAPLSAPPPLHSHSTRSSSIQHQPPSRSTTTTPGRPSSGPIPDPQSPQDNEPDPPPPEVQLASPYEYGHNEEASSSSEQLLLPQDQDSSSAPPFSLPELPSLPQLSPLALEFRLDSAAASRSNSASTGRGSRRSGKSNKSNNSIGRGKGKGEGKEGKGHVKSPSKASSISAFSCGTGSKRSLRSLASFSSSSLRSRSKSRERGGDRGVDRVKHARRVTFGDTAGTPPPVPVRTPTPTHTHTPASRASTPAEQSQSRNNSPVPVLMPQKRPSRPLPTLPATLIAGYSIPLPGQVGSRVIGGPPGPQQQGRGNGNGNGNGEGGYVVH
ncbi:uncharacterized protein FOMMEDRAFT_138172 [Fomitiporia mediterranea MF3/22]|uniref:uncharacterized protein n=1 Tax=Fomitiporia mediterranea (strain MF3/22) TaxID=694068 RepID=UPI0004408F0F|nr:uncharacterized protein FOMMEDRAFT_138172 [Fomitiporia mediterranea MF3/22]EJD08226.1 hypothetical protein FOMMEDRAFT_138172 [Fomitiporia mediterranea MF3/22]